MEEKDICSTLNNNKIFTDLQQFDISYCKFFKQEGLKSPVYLLVQHVLECFLNPRLTASYLVSLHMYQISGQSSYQGRTQKINSQWYYAMHSRAGKARLGWGLGSFDPTMGYSSNLQARVKIIVNCPPWLENILK